jgi:hypothetical protein
MCGETKFPPMGNAFIADGVRTPIGSFTGSLSPVRADDLAAHTIAELMRRHPNIPTDEITDVILGCANQAGEDNRNVARMSAFLAGCRSAPRPPPPTACAGRSWMPSSPPLVPSSRVKLNSLHGNHAISSIREFCSQVESLGCAEMRLKQIDRARCPIQFECVSL